MVTFDCPWCGGPASVDAVALDEFCCEECGLRIELAPDPPVQPIARAA